MNRQELENLFISIAEQHEDCESIKECIRGLQSSNVITNNDYNYILKEWDNMLERHSL